MPASFKLDLSDAQNFKRMKRDFDSTLASANDKANNIVLEYQKSNTSGKLRNSLFIEEAVDAKGRVTSRVVSDVPYALEAEARKPFMRPSIDLNRSKIIRTHVARHNKIVGRYRV